MTSSISFPQLQSYKLLEKPHEQHHSGGRPQQQMKQYCNKDDAKRPDGSCISQFMDSKNAPAAECKELLLPLQCLGDNACGPLSHLLGKMTRLRRLDLSVCKTPDAPIAAGIHPFNGLSQTLVESCSSADDAVTAFLQKCLIDMAIYCLKSAVFLSLDNSQTTYPPWDSPGC
ncbi:hypothetical protein Emag_007533 [Eimeria magna]